jgi:hypothetical protein
MAVWLAMAHTAGAGPFTRTKLGDDLGGGGQPAEPEASSPDTDLKSGISNMFADEGRFDLAAALVIGIPTGDYGSAVGTGFGLSAYGGFLLHPAPLVRIAIGPALAYQSYGFKGGGGSAGLFDITAKVHAEYYVPAAPGLALLGDLGLGLGVAMLSTEFGGGETQTNVGAFQLGAGAAVHLTLPLALTGEIAYERTPTNGDAAGRITVAIGGSYAY